MSTPTVTGTSSLDAALIALSTSEATWAATDLRARRALLEQVHELIGRHAQEWVDAAVGVKGLSHSSPLVGEEWLSGPYAMLTGLTALADSLKAIEKGKSPVDGFKLGTAPGGRVTVRVTPHGLYDRLLLSGFTADVWMKPGVDAQTVRRQAGLSELDPTNTHGVAVVLGAGNITSIAPLDVIYELYAHNRVVALKLNPITDGLYPVLAKVLAPLIELGVLKLLTGGADVGGYLVQHDLVNHVHMTGSAITHDAIVWGRGEEAARRKAAKTPLLDKIITSELGGVSPVVVVPGRWSRADLKFQAQHIATMRLHNGGYNCIAAQVVVLSSDWPQKARFLKELRKAFAAAPQRTPYYPGSDRRVAEACDAYPGATPQGGRVLIADPGPKGRDYLLNTEFFAPVLGIVELPGDAPQFLQAAVRSANEEFHGTLGVNVVAHPKTIKQLGVAFENAIADLRYGCVAVNAWTGLGFLTARGSWGAFPGHTTDDVQSGIGVVHNALLLDGPERTVIRGPFRPIQRSLTHGEASISPKPPWFVNNRTAAHTGRALVTFAAKPSPLRIPRVVLNALRG
ncbi:aldehyde dehydrogenase family protein [Spongisporangium articulatum]|uniref:Aldehyde dehydrogenase family protein n=1 Tax=Spongisporangium articulatum TaxID=3362603 RepID=A0ABW8AIT1_9ACTN